MKMNLKKENNGCPLIADGGDDPGCAGWNRGYRTLVTNCLECGHYTRAKRKKWPKKRNEK